MEHESEKNILDQIMERIQMISGKRLKTDWLKHFTKDGENYVGKVTLLRALSGYPASHDRSHALGIIYDWISRNYSKMSGIQSLSRRIEYVIECFRRYDLAVKASDYKELVFNLSTERAKKIREEVERTGVMFNDALMELELMIRECENDKWFLNRLRTAVEEVCTAQSGYGPPQEDSQTQSDYVFEEKASDVDLNHKSYLLNEQGFKLLAEDNYIEALKILNKAIEFNLNNKDAWYNIGSCFYKLKKYDGALKSYIQVLRLDPYNEEMAKELAILSEAISDCKDTDLNNYLTSFECNEFGSSKLKEYFDPQGSGDTEILKKAIILCNKAIELSPNFSEAFNNRGLAHEYLEHYENALKDYQRALEIKPNYAIAWYNKGMYYNRIFEREWNTNIGIMALHCFKKVLEFNPRDSDAERMITKLEKEGIYEVKKNGIVKNKTKINTETQKSPRSRRKGKFLSSLCSPCLRIFSKFYNARKTKR